jgi:hypothetical protein
VQYRYDAVGNRLEMTEGQSGGTAGAACPGDTDCDGRSDITDACPTVANAAQTDSDAPATPGGLVAGYNMNEETGGWHIGDVTGRNHGTSTVGPGHVPGKYGNGLGMVLQTEAPQVVRVPSSLSLDHLGKELTVMAWINPSTQVTSSAVIMNKGSQFTLRYGRLTPHTLNISFSTGSGFDSFGATSPDAAAFPDGVWTHRDADRDSHQPEHRGGVDGGQRPVRGLVPQPGRGELVHGRAEPRRWPVVVHTRLSGRRQWPHDGHVHLDCYHAQDQPRPCPRQSAGITRRIGCQRHQVQHPLTPEWASRAAKWTCESPVSAGGLKLGPK